MKDVKRWLCGCFAFLLCFVLCGCSLLEGAESSNTPSSSTSEAEADQTTVSAQTTTTTTAPTPPGPEVPMTLLGNGYAYSQLDDKQQENYEAAVKELYEQRGQETEIKGEYGLAVRLPHSLRSEEEVEELFHAVYHDHPEFFYLMAKYGWVKLVESYSYVHFYYIWDAQQRADKAVEFEEAVSSLVAQAEGLEPVEQELLFHDALTATCDYNTEAADETEALSTLYYEASSPYAALCTFDPICGGYSRAFQLLLSRVGIVSTMVSNDNHAWTMVWLDGEAYHTDVTWDDPVSGPEQHVYFNITEEETYATRDKAVQELALPEATAVTYNYFVMNGWYFTELGDAVEECIRSQIESGSETIKLKFSADAYDDAVIWLFEEQGFFDAVYELEDDDLRDYWYQTVHYLEEESLGTLQIRLPEE